MCQYCTYSRMLGMEYFSHLHISQYLTMSPVLNEIVSNEIVSNEIVSKEIVSNEIVSNEIVSNEIVLNEIVSNEIVRVIIICCIPNIYKQEVRK